MNRFVFFFLLISNSALAEVADCLNPQEHSGVSKIAEFNCAEGMCGIRVTAPLKYEGYNFVGFTLIKIRDDSPALYVPMEYHAQESLAEVTFYANYEETSILRVAGFFSKAGECGVQSTVEFTQHNK